jgi:hypothetical protein
MRTKPEKTVSLWMFMVWSGDWENIAKAEADAAMLRSWQPARLAKMISTTELSKVIGCGTPHASEIRNGTRGLTPEHRQTVEKYLREKIESQK